MANRHRGDIAATLDGNRYTLRLTLGALAELEDAFGVPDLMALAERFENGRLSSRDAIKILSAGLRGAGHDMSDEAVMRMASGEGAPGYIRAVADLLAATFGGGDEGERGGEAAAPGPFPGAR